MAGTTTSLRSHSRPWIRQGIGGLLLVAATTFIARLLEGHLGIANLALLYLLPVIVQSGRAGLGAGLFTSVMAALAFNYFLVPPRYTFHITHPDNLVTMLVLFAVAVVISELAARLRHQAERAGELARVNAGLAAFSDRLAAMPNNEAVLAELDDALSAELGVRARPIDRPHDQTPSGELDGLGIAAACWTQTHGERTGRGTSIMSGADRLFVPLTVAGHERLVLAIEGSSALPLTADRQPLFDGMIERAEHALARVALATERMEIERNRQREQLREALLSSISHDLRTPLTAIRAGLENLGEGAGKKTALDAIKSETARLERLVMNLLEMTRIEAGAPISREVIDLTDTIAAVIEAFPADQGHAVRISLPPDLPLLRSDARMLHHMLLNLLDNAIRHGGAEGVEIAAARDGGDILLMVRDAGPGIPAGREDAIFERFSRIDQGDRHGRAGLGLAIVRGFGNALGLTTSAANRPGGAGAVFTIRFHERTLIATPHDIA